MEHPSEKPQEIFAGESKTWLLSVTNADTGGPLILTGATIELQVKADVGGADPPLITKAVGAGIAILDQGVDATKGKAEISFIPADTSGVSAPAPGPYRYDVVLVLLDGTRKYIIPPSPFTIVDVVNQAP